MVQVVLFHSGLGLRPHLDNWRKALESDGHVVHTPDLYDGEVFDELDAGVKKRDTLGIPELARRGAAAVEHLPTDVVYAGFSLGAANAQALALTRPGARGLVLMHAALPPIAFGTTAWPTVLPTQIHATTKDPWVDREAVDAVRTLAGEQAELFDYEGDAHLFADDDYVDFDPAMAETMLGRVRRFLRDLD